MQRLLANRASSLQLVIVLMSLAAVAALRQCAEQPGEQAQLSLPERRVEMRLVPRSARDCRFRTAVAFLAQKPGEPGRRMRQIARRGVPTDPARPAFIRFQCPCGRVTMPFALNSFLRPTSKMATLQARSRIGADYANLTKSSGRARKWPDL